MRPVLLTVVMATLAQPALAEIQIRAVTLSTAGLALLSAEGQIGNAPGDQRGDQRGDQIDDHSEGAALTLPVRRDHINAFLQSVLIADPSGAIPGLRLTGPSGQRDLFATFPFTAEDLQSLPSLVAAMTGAPVTARRHGIAISGAVMGVGEAPCDGAPQTQCPTLTLRTDAGGVHQTLLDTDTFVLFDDHRDQDAITRGLDALRQQARGQMLDVTITSTEDTLREIGLGWLQPATPWTTAWRAEYHPEGLTLTAWAIVENTTGHDWDAVELSLATGAVQVLAPQLYDRAPPIRPYPALGAAVAADSMTMRAAIAENAHGLGATGMDDGDSFSRYTLSAPVSVRAGQMISLPFLRETLTEGRSVLFQGGTGAVHPMWGVDLANPLPLRLPAGVVSIFEAGRGHAGDAMIPELAPGARDWIGFARDTALTLREDIHEAQSIHAARIIDGLLFAEERIERRTDYRIDAADAQDRQLIIAHPRAPGWDIRTEGGTELLDEIRFTLDVPAGALLTHSVVETRSGTSRIVLGELDDDALAFWSGQVPDDAVRALLERLQTLRGQERQLARQLRDLDDDEQALIADQERLAGLIVQLGSGSAGTDARRERVDRIEEELDTLRAARAALRDRRDQVQADLRAALAGSD